MFKTTKLLAAVALGVLVAAPVAQAQEMKFFRIGTGGAGGTYFSIGGIVAFAAYHIWTAVAGYFMTALNPLWRILMAIAGVLLVAPGWQSDIVAIVIATPVLLSQFISKNKPVVV